MSEFTVVNPRKRSRSNSSDSTTGNKLVSESAQTPPDKKQKKADDSGTESDKENTPKTPKGSLDKSYEIYEASTTVIDQEANDSFVEWRNYKQTENEAEPEHLYQPSDSLLRDDSIVPKHLLLKKYDTKPPPIPSREHILAAAEKLIFAKPKRVPESDFPGADSEHSHSVRPMPKRRTPKNTKRSETNLDNATSNTGPKKTTVDGRTMITATKLASNLQKLIFGFPLPQGPFPEDFTLTELCAQYPNHLFGDQLYPFLQHQWTPTKIAKLLPDQSHVAGKDQVTSNAIASRLRKAKLALEKAGKYVSLMAAPKTHTELWNNVSERKSTDTDVETEDEVEETEVIEGSDVKDQSDKSAGEIESTAAY